MKDEICGKRKWFRPSAWLIYIIMFILGLLVLAPFYYVLITAFKSNGQILAGPTSPPTEIFLENFKAIFNREGFGLAVFNSIFMTTMGLILQVILIPMAAYPIARWRTRLNTCIYYIFLIGLMVPFYTIMIPLIKGLKIAGLIGSRWGVILVYVSYAPAFGVFLYTGFIRNIPKDIDESGVVDGASYYSIFWRLIFPLLKPCTFTLIIFNTVGMWNDFLCPSLILTGKSGQTIVTAMYAYVARYSSKWGPIFAGSLIVIAPMILLYLLLQERFIKGLTAGAVKG